MTETSIAVPRLAIPQTQDATVRAAFTEQALAQYGVDLATLPALFEFERLIGGVRWLDARQENTFVSGCTEPWIAQLVSSLLVASGQHSVLETGTFTGTTAAWLCLTLAQMGGGEFLGCELDPERSIAADARLAALELPETVRWRIATGDVLQTVQALPNESLGFVWVDDDHTHSHVAEELVALMPKMRPGGLICGHDVHGSCALHEEFARYPNSIALDLPRLGPAGGLGIIQV